ncbi:MAG: glycosyltransferase family 4 protein [Oceanospirillaceae bacterium]|nr:glycosyltransferase family 4 protein [Oceanospirillaceae bacterium]
MNILIASYGRYHSYRQIDSLRKFAKVSAFITDHAGTLKSAKLYRSSIILCFFHGVSIYLRRNFNIDWFETLVKFSHDVSLSVKIIIFRKKYDVIVIYSGTSFYASRIVKMVKLPLVIERAGISPLKQRQIYDEYCRVDSYTPESSKRTFNDKLSKMEDELYLADLVLTTSVFSKQSFPEVVRKATKVIYLGINRLEASQGYDVNGSITFIGTDPVIKGLSVFLKIISTSKPGEFNFTIVSDYKFFHEKIEDLCQKGYSIIYMKSASKAALEFHISNSRCVVVPSRFDAFNMVAGESTSLSVPVVTNSNVGFSELVKKYGGGYVFSNNDALVDEFWEKVVDKEELLKRSNEAFLLSQTVSWDKYARELYISLKGLCGV